MKVTPAHLDTLRTLVTARDTDTTREAYRTGRYPRAHLTQDVDKRYRWDLLWAVYSGTDRGALEDILDGRYNDAHLDTALRSVVPALTEPAPTVTRTCVGCFTQVRPNVPTDHARGCPTGQNGTPDYS